MVRRGLAALSLALCAGASAARVRPPQEGAARPMDVALVREADELAVGLRERLMTAGPVERATLAAELAPLVELLREELSFARGPGEERQVHLALYRALTARAELDESLALDERLELFGEAERMAAASGAVEAHARALFVRGELLAREGRLVPARAEFRRALDEAQGAERTRAFAWFALAEAEARLGNPSGALAALERAVAESLEGEPWDRLRGRVAGSRGQVYLDLGRLDRAAQCFAEEERALEPLRPQAERFWKDFAARDLHAVHLALAERRWRRAAELARAAGEENRALAEPWRAVLESVRAEALARLADEDPEVAPAADEAFRAALAGPLPERDRMVCEARYAGLATRRGDLERAAELLARARERGAALERAGGPRELESEETLLATQEALLALAEAARGEADGAELAARLARLEEAFRRRLALWSDSPLLPGGTGFLQQPARRSWLWALARLALALDPREGAERALALVLLAQEQGVLARRLGLSAPAPSALRGRACSAGRGLVVWLPTPEGTLAFACDARATRLFELPPEGVLFACARDGEPAELERLLLLESGLGAWLAGHRSLSLLGWELLGRLPFEDLRDAAGRRLGEGCALAFLPSAGVALHLAELPPGTPGPRAWLGPPAAPAAARRVPEPEPLRLDEAAWRRLAPSLGPAVRRVDGAAATPSALAELLGSAPVVQVLAHGVPSEDGERGALLVLAPEPATAAGPGSDGLVGAEQVERWPSSELVVLTACGGGAGALRRGDAAMGNLGGAFLVAGARCVVLGEEDLRLGPTLELSARLHEALGEGLAPAEALRRARAALAARLGWEALGGLRTLRAVGWGWTPPLPAGAGSPLPPAQSGGRGAALAGALLLALVAVGAWARARTLRARGA